MIKKKYLDDELFSQCQVYMQLFLVMEELESIEEYDTTELYERIGFLLNDLSISLSRIRNENYDIVTDINDGVERFNYTYTMGEYAELEDVMDKEFLVRVHQDDIVGLDELLNGLYNNVEDLKGANHNLNRIINNYNQLLDKKIVEYSDDDNVLGVLEDLKRICL